MKEIKYSCEDLEHTANYKLLHSNKKYPRPRPSGVYYWHISNFTPDMEKEKVILAFNRAWNIWQEAMDAIYPQGRYITFMTTSELHKADFIITFGKGFHEFPDALGSTHTCPFPFDGQKGILAHAWALTTAKPFGGQMHCDEDENWSEMQLGDRNPNKTDLLTTIIHEIGHMLGLDHSEIESAMMGMHYNGVKIHLHEDDHQGLTKRFLDVKGDAARKQGWVRPKSLEKKKSWWSRLLSWLHIK